MSSEQTLEFVRDAINGLRSDVAGVYSRLDDAVTSNQALHRDVEARLGRLESPQYGRLAWIGPVARVAWPGLLILAVLLRDASTETKRQVTQIASTAAGLPDISSGASIRPEHASTTWVAPRTSGGR